MTSVEASGRGTPPSPAEFELSCQNYTRHSRVTVRKRRIIAVTEYIASVLAYVLLQLH